MFDSLSTRVDEMTNDTGTELTNFDENLQVKAHCLNDMFTMLKQIYQALLTVVSQVSQGTNLSFDQSGTA